MQRLILLLLALAVMVSVSAYASIETSVPDWTRAQYQLHEIANMARALGLPEDSPIITEAQRLWWAEQAEADEELRVLANTIRGEAPHCTDEHQQYVAAVVLNRKADARFPDTVSEIVCAPGQYNPVYAGALLADPRTEDEMLRCVLNAQAAREDADDCPAGVVFQSEFKDLGTGIWKAITVDTGWYKSTTYFNYG